MKKPKARWNPLKTRWEAKGINPESGKRRTYCGDSAAEASDKAYESFGHATGPVDTLYGFYAGVYLPTIVKRSQNWKNQVAWAMDNYVIPVFGHKLLTEIDRPSAQKFFNSITIDSVGQIKIVWSCVMNLAEDDEMISKNPIRRVRLAPREAKEKTALTIEEVAALIQATPQRYLPPLILMLSSLNVGEACALRRNNIVNGQVQVRRQILQEAGGAVDTDKLKTPQRKRDIPLPAAVLDMLRDAGQVSSIWISSSSKGGYLLPNNVHREMEKAIVKAGIRRVTPHELRHTFMSVMEMELECPRPIVYAIAGKLIGGYQHVHPSQKKRWMEKYWGLILDQVSTGRVDKSVSTQA